MSIDNVGTESATRTPDMDDIRELLDTAIDDSVLAVEKLEQQRDEEHAEDACLACRTAVQLLAFAWGDFGQSATTKTPLFTSVLSRAGAACEKLGKERGKDSIVWKYRENFAIRQELVNALITDDTNRVRSMLTKELLGAH